MKKGTTMTTADEMDASKKKTKNSVTGHEGEIQEVVPTTIHEPERKKRTCPTRVGARPMLKSKSENSPHSPRDSSKPQVPEQSKSPFKRNIDILMEGEKRKKENEKKLRISPKTKPKETEDKTTDKNPEEGAGDRNRKTSKKKKFSLWAKCCGYEEDCEDIPLTEAEIRDLSGEYLYLIEKLHIVKVPILLCGTKNDLRERLVEIAERSVLSSEKSLYYDKFLRPREINSEKHSDNAHNLSSFTELYARGDGSQSITESERMVREPSGREGDLDSSSTNQSISPSAGISAVDESIATVKTTQHVAMAINDDTSYFAKLSSPKFVRTSFSKETLSSNRYALIPKEKFARVSAECQRDDSPYVGAIPAYEGWDRGMSPFGSTDYIVAHSRIERESKSQKEEREKKESKVRKAELVKKFSSPVEAGPGSSRQKPSSQTEARSATRLTSETSIENIATSSHDRGSSGAGKTAHNQSTTAQKRKDSHVQSAMKSPTDPQHKQPVKRATISEAPVLAFPSQSTSTEQQYPYGEGTSHGGHGAREEEVGKSTVAQLEPIQIDSSSEESVMSKKPSLRSMAMSKESDVLMEDEKSIPSTTTSHKSIYVDVSGRSLPKSSVHAILNQYSSIFVENLKDPIPKDPLTLPRDESDDENQPSTSREQPEEATPLQRPQAPKPQANRPKRPSGSGRRASERTQETELPEQQQRDTQTEQQPTASRRSTYEEPVEERRPSSNLKDKDMQGQGQRTDKSNRRTQRRSTEREISSTQFEAQDASAVKDRNTLNEEKGVTSQRRKSVNRRSSSREAVQQSTRDSLDPTVRDVAESHRESTDRRPREDTKRTTREVIDRSSREDPKSTSREVIDRSSREDPKRTSREVIDRSPREEPKRASREVIYRSSREDPQHISMEVIDRSPREDTKRTSREVIDRSHREEPKRTSREVIDRSSREDPKRTSREVIDRSPRPDGKDRRSASIPESPRTRAPSTSAAKRREPAERRKATKEDDQLSMEMGTIDLSLTTDTQTTSSDSSPPSDRKPYQRYTRHDTMFMHYDVAGPFRAHREPSPTPVHHTPGCSRRTGERNPNECPSESPEAQATCRDICTDTSSPGEEPPTNLIKRWKIIIKHQQGSDDDDENEPKK